jgi:enterobactin synthetase component D
MFGAPWVPICHTHHDDDDAAAADLRRWAAIHAVAVDVPPAHRDRFLAGRFCAAQAIARLVAHPLGGVIGRDAHGRPAWPAGCIGSITHTDGFAAAAIVRTHDYAALGIDAELMHNEAIASEIEGQVLCAQEAEVARHAGLSRTEAVFLAFSAKESLYKCLHPLVGQFFGFRDAGIERIDPAQGTLALRLLTTLNDRFVVGMTVEGRFAFTSRWVRTAAFIPQPAHSAKRRRQPRRAASPVDGGPSRPGTPVPHAAAVPQSGRLPGGSC